MREQLAAAPLHTATAAFQLPPFHLPTSRTIGSDAPVVRGRGTHPNSNHGCTRMNTEGLSSRGFDKETVRPMVECRSPKPKPAPPPRILPGFTHTPLPQWETQELHHCLSKFSRKQPSSSVCIRVHPWCC